MIGPPWTRARRQLLIDSRVKTTQALLDWSATRRCTAARPGDRQRHRFLRARRGDDWLTESSPAKEAFQSRLCVEREAAANAGEAQGMRVVNLRIGLVLGP